MAIVEKHKSPATVATPPDGYTTLFIRSDTEVPAIKDSNGTVSDLFIPGDASGVTYTPENSLNWTDSVDPGQVDDALDDLALRVVTLESENDPNSFGTIAVSGQSDVVAEQANDTLTLVAGTGISLTTSAGGDSVTITSTGATLAFGTIAVSGQSDVVADVSPDTLTLAAGAGMTITTDAGTDTITFTPSVDASQVSFTPQYSINWTDSEDPGQVDDALDDLAARVQFLESNPGGGGNSFGTVAVSGQSDVVAEQASDTLTLVAGSGIAITTNAGTDSVTIATSGSSGAVVQVKNTQTGAVATGNTAIPQDDTIPQNTEGTEFMTLAITPTSATNKLKIDVVAFVANDTASRWTISALFQDSTANALAAAQTFNDTATAGGCTAFTHYMTAGTTSSTTFKVRIGSNGADQVTFNGQNGVRRFGGVMASSITITEIVP